MSALRTRWKKDEKKDVVGGWMIGCCFRGWLGISLVSKQRRLIVSRAVLLLQSEETKIKLDALLELRNFQRISRLENSLKESILHKAFGSWKFFLQISNVEKNGKKKLQSHFFCFKIHKIVFSRNLKIFLAFKNNVGKKIDMRLADVIRKLFVTRAFFFFEILKKKKHRIFILLKMSRILINRFVKSYFKTFLRNLLEREKLFATKAIAAKLIFNTSEKIFGRVIFSSKIFPSPERRAIFRFQKFLQKCMQKFLKIFRLTISRSIRIERTSKRVIQKYYSQWKIHFKFSLANQTILEMEKKEQVMKISLGNAESQKLKFLNISENIIKYFIEKFESRNAMMKKREFFLSLKKQTLRIRKLSKLVLKIHEYNFRDFVSQFRKFKKCFKIFSRISDIFSKFFNKQIYYCFLEIRKISEIRKSFDELNRVVLNFCFRIYLLIPLRQSLRKKRKTSAAKKLGGCLTLRLAEHFRMSFGKLFRKILIHNTASIRILQVLKSMVRIRMNIFFGLLGLRLYSKILFASISLIANHKMREVKKHSYFFWKDISLVSEKRKCRLTHKVRLKLKMKIFCFLKLKFSKTRNFLNFSVFLAIFIKRSIARNFSCFSNNLKKLNERRANTFLFSKSLQSILARKLFELVKFAFRSLKIGNRKFLNFRENSRIQTRCYLAWKSAFTAVRKLSSFFDRLLLNFQRNSFHHFERQSLKSSLEKFETSSLVLKSKRKTVAGFMENVMNRQEKNIMTLILLTWKFQSENSKEKLVRFANTILRIFKNFISQVFFRKLLEFQKFRDQTKFLQDRKLRGARSLFARLCYGWYLRSQFAFLLRLMAFRFLRNFQASERIQHKEFSALRKTISKLEDERLALVNETGMMQVLKDEIKNLKNSMQILDSTKTELTERLATSEKSFARQFDLSSSELVSYQDENKKLKNEILNLRSEIVVLSQSFSRQEHDHLRASEIFCGIREDLGRLEEDNNRLQTKIDSVKRLEKVSEEQNEELDILRSKIKVLEDERNSLENDFLSNSFSTKTLVKSQKFYKSKCQLLTEQINSLQNKMSELNERSLAYIQPETLMRESVVGVSDSLASLAEAIRQRNSQVNSSLASSPLRKSLRSKK